MGRKVLFGWIIMMIAVIWLAGMTATADSVEVDETNRAVRVTCEHAEAGKPYSFIATTGSDLSGGLNREQVQYLNQFTADSNGQIQVLILDEKMKGAKFYLGGGFQDMESPHLIGVYGDTEITAVITLPAMLVQIDEEAFAGGVFQAVYLGDQVQSIGKAAFRDCKSLVYVQIPPSVTEIAPDAFEGCGKLTFCCVKDSKAWQYATEHDYGIEELTGSAEEE